MGQRGRDPGRRRAIGAVSGAGTPGADDAVLALAAMAAAVAVGGLALGAVEAQLEEGWSAAPVGWAVVLGLGTIGASLLAGAFASAWWTLRSHRSRLTLPAAAVPAGGPLEAVLEIPFAVPDVPDMRLLVTLTRLEGAGPGSGGSVPSTAWARSVRVERSTWSPAGPGRVRARLSFDLPPSEPAPVTDRRIGYLWSLEAVPEGGVAWRASFRVPLRIAPPAVTRAA